MNNTHNNEWQDIGSPQDEWQDISRPNTPADANLSSLQFNAKHPYLKALSDTADQSVGNFTKGAYDALSFIPGFNQIMQEPFTPAPANNPISQLGSNISYGLGSALPTIAMANPFIKGAGTITSNPILQNALGIGGFQGTTSALQGQPIQSIGGNALRGALQGGLMGGMGQIGANLGNKIASPLVQSINPISKRIVNMAPSLGASSGMAGASALMAPSGQKLSNAMIGGGLGLLNPIDPVNNITPEKYNDIIDKNADIYRQQLNPGKALLQNFEIKSDKDYNDAMRLAAQRGIILNKDINGKLDTSQAISQLQPFMNSLRDKSLQILNSDQNKQFDLEDLRSSALDGLSKYSQFKNDTARNEAESQINGQVNDAISNRGQFIDANNLNQMKEGFYNNAYSADAPNKNIVARELGHQSMSALNDAYEKQGLSGINSQLGKYLDLQTILNKAHGQNAVVGKEPPFLRIGGGILGALGGFLIPGPEKLGAIPAGIMGGAELGKGISHLIGEHFNNPEVITKGLANKSNINVGDTSSSLLDTLNPIGRLGNRKSLNKTP